MAKRDTQSSNHIENTPSASESISLDVLGLSTRAYNCLRRAGVSTVADVASLTDEQILSIRQVGVKTQAEIKEKLAAYLDENPLPEQIQTPRPQREEQVPLSRMRVDVLQLSLGAYDALQRAGVLTLGHLAQMSSRKILDIQGINEKDLDEIERKLQPYRALLFSEQTMSPELADTPISVLDLSTRSYSALTNGGFSTIGQLAQMSSRQIRGIHNVGEKSLAEIEERLEAYLAEHSLHSEIDTYSSDNRVPVPADTPISVLDLSTRSHNALRRGDVSTIGQLAQMSSRQIRGIHNVGEKSLAEIEEKLEDYLVEHSLHVVTPVESDLPTPLIDPELQKRAGCAPLDDISVQRLGLPDAWQSQVLQAGITSIGELTRQATDALGKAAPLKERLERYLTWLIGQDEAIWADEVAGRGISPLHRIELSETSLDDLIEDWLSSLETIDGRDKHVIRWRYALHDGQLTLEEVGDRLGVSRERARQLEKRAVNQLSTPQNLAAIRPLTALLVYLLEQAGSLMNEEQVNAALRQELVVDNVDPIGVVHLVFEINNDVKWLRGAEAWGLKGTPLNEVRGVQKRLARVLEKEHVPLSVDEVIARFKSTRFYHNRQEKLKNDFVLACLRVHLEISVDNEGQCGLKQWERHRLDEMILVLRGIGEPVHYTEIAEKTNALLEPEMQASAHNIHAHMQRLPDIFVRVGHGVYGLAEWGLHDDGSLANAAHRVLSEAGKPLHQDFIADRVLETWKARRSSVYVALQTDDRFVRIGPGVYWLHEKIATGSEAGEADFGDLFGERLEEWQEELPLEENGPDYDTHAEADAIRQMGMDFFK